MEDHQVRILSWTRATDAEARTGKLGYVNVEIAGLVIDGITVRRTADGRLCLSFPARFDRGGRKHPIVRPATDASRREVERQVIEQLGQQFEVEP